MVFILDLLVLSVDLVVVDSGSVVVVVISASCFVTAVAAVVLSAFTDASATVVVVAFSDVLSTAFSAFWVVDVVAAGAGVVLVSEFAGEFDEDVYFWIIVFTKLRDVIYHCHYPEFRLLGLVLSLKRDNIGKLQIRPGDTKKIS